MADKKETSEYCEKGYHVELDEDMAGGRERVARNRREERKGEKGRRFRQLI